MPAASTERWELTRLLPTLPGPRRCFYSDRGISQVHAAVQGPSQGLKSASPASPVISELQPGRLALWERPRGGPVLLGCGHSMHTPGAPAARTSPAKPFPADRPRARRLAVQAHRSPGARDSRRKTVSLPGVVRGVTPL